MPDRPARLRDARHTFGPELDVHAQFGTAGTCQLWGQLRTTDGDVLTAPFTVDARCRPRRPAVDRSRHHPR